MGVLEHAWKSYFRNFKLILFFSIPALLAFLIPMLSPLPTYLAVGGTFLRTSSVPELTGFDMAVMIVASLASLFLFSFAIVAISIVVRKERTLTRISREVIAGIERYVFSVFWLFLTAELLLMIVGFFAYDWRMQNWLNPIAGLIASVFLLYAPAALVIDDLSPVRALKASFKTVMSAPELFIIFIAITVVSLSVVEALGLWLFGSAAGHMLALVFNALILLPFLVVLSAQTYMMKYPLAK